MTNKDISVPRERELSEHDQETARFLAVAICTMTNPPSWDEAFRIASHLVAEGFTTRRNFTPKDTQ